MEAEFVAPAPLRVPFFFRPPASNGNSVIRCETYCDETKKKTEVCLTLSEQFLSYTITTLHDKKTSPSRSVPVSTLLGAVVVSDLVLRVLYFPLDRKNNVRRQCVITFTMNSAPHAQSWAQTINFHLAGCTKDDVMPRRHVLVLLNPFSGTKKAGEIWKNIVEPIWTAAGMTCEVVETQYSGHAREVARMLDLTKFDLLVTVSGDGLFWELLNGLLMRPDWSEAAKIPLSVVPGGSGNALAFSAGLGDPETAAFSIARGRARPIDVATVLQERHRCASFLIVAWGLVADVDFESERFRWMGAPRFVVTGIQRMMSLRLYKGRFSYYPQPDWKREECAGADCTQCLKPVFPGAPRGGEREVQWDQTRLALEKKGGPFAGLETESLPPGPPTPLLDALRGGDETGWVHVESDEFVLLTASNFTHVASDMKSAPFAHWSDGCWDVVMLKRVSKATLLKLFVGFETGEHVKSPDVTYIKCRAFRLEPDTSVVGSFIDVDGERMPSYGPTYSEMHRGLCNFVAY